MSHENEYAVGVMSGGNMRKLGMHRKHESKKHEAKEKALKKAKGVHKDWGKTKPYWSLKTGKGFDEAEHVRD